MFNMKRKALLIGAGAAFLVATSLGARLFFSKPPAPPISKAGLEKLAKADTDVVVTERKKNGAPSPVERGIQLADAWLARGKITADGADFDRAMDYVNEAAKQAAISQKAEEVKAQWPDITAERARVLRARHRFVEARVTAEKGLRDSPDHDLLLGLAGDAAVQSGDLLAGENYLRKLTNAAPRVPSNWIALAYWAEISGDLEQAAELLRQAPNASAPKPLTDERIAYVNTVLADVVSKQGNFAEARRLYDFAMTKAKDYAQARSGLADVEQYAGNDAAAEKLLRGLIESEWPNADYKVKLAGVRERLGDAAEAKSLRREAEIFYEWSVSTGYDGYLRPLATLKLADGDYVAAAKLAARDLELRPNSESRTIYQNVLNQAKAAGKPVSASGLPDLRQAGAR